jgi:hypothetical protein
MKRCPRCSFIYEDDQRLCDLDGGELVYASGILPPPDTAALRPPAPRVKSRRSALTVLPLAGVLLAAVLFLIYSAVPQRAALTGREQYSTATPQPDPKITQSPTPAAFTPPPAPARPVTDTKAIRRAAPTPRLVKVNPRPPASEREEKAPQPQGESNKKDSKLGSILKKTGRLLKKPFKF